VSTKAGEKNRLEEHPGLFLTFLTFLFAVSEQKRLGFFYDRE